jgi:N utilization substance protein A
MSNLGISANRLELLQIAEAVAQEKSIDPEIVIEAMEEGIMKAARSRYGNESTIEAEIDRTTGKISLVRLLEVVEDVISDSREISLKVAKEKNPAAQIGDMISESLPPIDFGRVAAQAAKQVITTRVRDAERDRQYEEFKDRVGENINGVVKRIEYGNILVDLNNAEGVIKRDEYIPREKFRNNERVRAYIYDVRREHRGHQIFLSRNHPQFMAKLFVQEVPEIYDGIIEIKSIARDPGSRAKIAVISKDSSIDPVGACVGMRGSRVQAIVNELQGEKIDIIQWSDDPATFIVQSLVPAEVSKVVLDEDAKRVEVVVPDDQLSLAIGRRGQNVRLATQLTEWEIDILTQKEESEKRQLEFTNKTGNIVSVLDVDETLAQLMISEGFETVYDFATSPLSDLSAVDGIDEDMALELQTRAKEYLQKQEELMDKKIQDLNIDKDIEGINGLTREMIIKLGENGVKTLDDFAGLSIDELIGGYNEVEKNSEDSEKKSKFSGILGEFKVSRGDAEVMIMQAREHWFVDNKTDEEKENSNETGETGETEILKKDF